LIAAWLPEVGGLGVTAPAADGDPDSAGIFGSELKAAGGRHGEPRDLGDNGTEPAMPQALLETDEDRRLIARLDIDHAIGQEPGLREGRGKQVRARDAP
jgi:hypothetical protein